MSPEVRKNQSRPDIAPGMTDMRLEALRLAALGLTNRQIAARFRITDKGVSRLHSLSYPGLGVHEKVAAILTFIDRGVFDLDELVDGFDLQKFDWLAPHHHKVLQAMVKDNGGSSDNLSIGRTLRYTTNSVSQRLYEIYKTIDENSRPRTAVLYLAYQRQQGQHAISENGGVVFSPAMSLTRGE